MVVSKHAFHAPADRLQAPFFLELMYQADRQQAKRHGIENNVFCIGDGCILIEKEYEEKTNERQRKRHDLLHADSADALADYVTGFLQLGLHLLGQRLLFQKNDVCWFGFSTENFVVDLTFLHQK